MTTLMPEGDENDYNTEVPEEDYNKVRMRMLNALMVERFGTRYFFGWVEPGNMIQVSVSKDPIKAAEIEIIMEAAGNVAKRLGRIEREKAIQKHKNELSTGKQLGQ